MRIETFVKKNMSSASSGRGNWQKYFQTETNIKCFN